MKHKLFTYSDKNTHYGKLNKKIMKNLKCPSCNYSYFNYKEFQNNNIFRFLYAERMEESDKYKNFKKIKIGKNIILYSCPKCGIIFLKTKES